MKFLQNYENKNYKVILRDDKNIVFYVCKRRPSDDIYVVGTNYNEKNGLFDIKKTFNVSQQKQMYKEYENGILF